jgi:hypothetical protein
MTARYVALLLALTTAPTLASGFDSLSPLRDAVARYPDDQDLAWALARNLADLDESEEAVAALDRLVARWPEHADAQLELAALLVADGRHAEALAHLDRAVALSPRSGEAQLLRGMALDGVGRFPEALQALAMAAELEPALHSESLLLRGIALIEHGELEAGFRLLEEVIELDPLGDVADAARLLLATAPPKPRPRLRLQAYGGMDYDSNVTLDSGSTPGLSSDRDDGAGIFGAMVAADALAADDHTLTLGARYHERDYLDLHGFDERTVLGFLQGQLRLHPRAALRFLSLGSWLMLDDESYLTQVKLQPDLLVQLGERAGVLQIAASVEGDWYDDDPLLPSLERDAIAFGGGLGHFFAIRGLRDARASWGFAYERVITDAKRDLLGFEGDYDRNVFTGHVQADLTLFWEISAQLSVGLTYERYDNDNLIDFLTQLDEDGTAKRRRRDDLLLETGLGLVRPLHEYVDLELRWRFQDRFSNTDVFQYERHVVGATVRVKTF